METILQKTKRALASKTQASIPTRLRCPDACNPKTTKWKQFHQDLCTHTDKHTHVSVPMFLEETSWSAADVWKAARKGLVCIDAQFRHAQEDDSWTPVLEWFDAIRNHWQRVECHVYPSRDCASAIQFVWDYHEHKTLTVGQMCERIEQSLPTYQYDGVATWNFVLDASDHGTVNLTHNVHECWWTTTRFGLDYEYVKRAPIVSVYLLEQSIADDPTMLEDLGLYGNRNAYFGTAVTEPASAIDQVDIRAKETYLSNERELKHEQDEAYYESLQADKEKALLKDSIDMDQEESKTEEDHALVPDAADVMPDTPLTREQLRLARLQFYSNA